MIEWPVVAAFIGPLIGAIGLTGGWFAYLGKRRDQRVAAQIGAVTTKLENNQALMQMQIDTMNRSMEAQTVHLNKQDETLSAALQTIARIDGRLAGMQISQVESGKGG